SRPGAQGAEQVATALLALTRRPPRQIAMATVNGAPGLVCATPMACGRSSRSPLTAAGSPPSTWSATRTSSLACGSRADRPGPAEGDGEPFLAGRSDPDGPAMGAPLDPAQLQQPGGDRGAQRAVQVRTAFGPVQAGASEPAPRAAQRNRIHAKRSQ